MKSRTIAWLGAFALGLGFERAGAQMSAAPTPRATAKPAPRTASIPPSPPPQPIVVNTTGLPAANVPASPVPSLVSPMVGAPVAQVTWYPTLVMVDGRVFANFGAGYEQVLRQCPQLSGTLPPNATIAPCFTVDAHGAYRVMQRR
jgi:hypothetical protein